MNRTVWKIFGVVFSGLVILLSAAYIHIDRSEWTLRPKSYDAAIPVEIREGTISEIEEQVKREVVRYYPKAYLGEIQWSVESDKGFTTLSEGKLQFTYCEKIGEENWYYRYDRYALCEVTVDLALQQIVYIDIYGNNQLGGYHALVQYPEIPLVRALLQEYSMRKPIEFCFVRSVNDAAQVAVKYVGEELIHGTIAPNRFTADGWMFTADASESRLGRGRRRSLR